MNIKSITGNIISWFFALIFMAIGIVNMFWGNDLYYGIFIFLLAFVFVPPAMTLFKNITGFGIPPFIKILLGIFITWTAIGVGELPAKLELMKRSF